MNIKLEIWEQFADIDPAFIKQITGKPYKGVSPNPQYVIRCLTQLFGPVGQGFGWRVLAEDFRDLGQETLHWCRIEFWHTDRANTFEAYGQTKAAYVTANGKQIVDEDAPKKSLTDAITKAASQLGVAANIFLGRWDDQKYVAAVTAEYRERDAPPFDAPATRDRIKAAIGKAETEPALESLWKHAATVAAFDKLPPPMQSELTKAYSDRMGQIAGSDEGDEHEVEFRL